MVQTISELLPTVYGNVTELARRIGCNKATVYKYMDDTNGEFHAVVNGKLMIRPGFKGRYTRDKR